MKENFQIVIAGVGGQGILFTSKVFYRTGLRLGMPVLGSETHGMSQRGGSVASYVKLGSFESPMIFGWSADVLYSMELNETYRNLAFIRRGGLCFANLKERSLLDGGVLSCLDSNRIALHTYDADRKALELGSILLANILLTGFSAGTGALPLDSGVIRSVIEEVSGEKYRKGNLEAFDIGFDAGSG